MPPWSCDGDKMEDVNDSHHADYDNQNLTVYTIVMHELTCYHPCTIYSDIMFVAWHSRLWN
jgi:hypothetical protein